MAAAIGAQPPFDHRSLAAGLGAIPPIVGRSAWVYDVPVTSPA